MVGLGGDDAHGGAVPEVVGPYRISDLIGSGSMAEVYDAADTRSGARVALKMLRPELARTSELVSRFLREGRALENIQHANLVRVFAHGVTDEGIPWIAMERMRGGTLKGLIRAEGQLEPARALRLARHIANALAAVHAHGVVHRDIKPENVFVVDPDAPTEIAKLIDFGLARVSDAELGAHSLRYTRVGDFLGTAAYVAPEQARGGQIDACADVFALAVTLYEMLSGKLPYEGEQIHQQLKARLEGKVVPLERRLREGGGAGGAALPPGLSQLLSRALSLDPSGRPANGAAMVAELDAIGAALGREPSSPAVPVFERVTAGAAGAAAAPPPTPAFAPMPYAPPSGSGRGGRLVAVLLVVVGLAVLAFLTVEALRRSGAFEP